MNVKQLIRAVDLVPPPAPIPDEDHVAEARLNPETDGLLMRLFGMVPDYSNPKLDEIYQELMERDRFELFDYCRGRGVEVLKDDGSPVAPWRDIATILTAVDRGVLNRAA